ncbi:MAG: hypothetical protein ACRDJC_10545 [Thermomicrobiales bacterium]
MDSDNQERNRPLPGIEGKTFSRIADQVNVEVLSAAIAGKESVGLSLLVTGEFERPGNRAMIERTVVVVTVPAKVLPR